MSIESSLRKHFWCLPALLIAVAAFLNAKATMELVGVALLLDAKDLARAPNALPRQTATAASPHVLSARAILERNPFDHVTGSLLPPASEVDGPTPDVADVDDPWAVPACDGISVRAIVASSDEDWSYASISGSDNKAHLLRRGGEIAGKSVHFVGLDRVWLASEGALCQVRLRDRKAPTSAPPTPVAAAPSASGSTRSRGAPLDPELRKGIHAVSATEFNIDRGVVDKILENQADLMRQARVIPVQESGRVVGIRLLGVRPDALLGVIGMQNGDQLRTINGFEMGNPEKALEAYARLRTANHLTIQLNRGGQNVNLDYNIK